MTDVFDNDNGKTLITKGEFNDSTVFFQPLKMNQKTIISKGMHNNTTKNLGIYENIKISSLIDNKPGKLISLISIDPKSQNTFFTQEGEEFLGNYPTQQIAFVFVAGNAGAGKSFFLDKILNLAEVKGNHFCRNKEPGIFVWSTPFIKEDLNIFLVQIAGCGINSPEFKILSMYALLTGSTFIVLEDINRSGQIALKKLDQALQKTVDRALSSRVEQQGKIRNNRAIFMPSVFYYLNRVDQKISTNKLSIIEFYIEKYLPDAKATGFKGDIKQLIHLPFLDTSCISEKYMNQIYQIFNEIYHKTHEKKYNQLILNGSIILKIIKEIEKYLNNKYQINIENLYEQLIEDLYLSGYNYCLLAYHQAMQKQFEDEEPKSFEDLLDIFEKISDSILEKFNDFNLDQRLHQIYFEKLRQHIDEKEQMIMDVNRSKTKSEITRLYDSAHLHEYHDVTDILKRIKPHLTHGKGVIVGEMLVQFWKDSGMGNSAERRAAEQAYRLSQLVAEKKDILEKIKKDRKLQEKIEKMKDNIDNMRNSNIKVDIATLHEEKRDLEQQIQRNQQLIQKLKKQNSKHKDQAIVQNKIVQVQKKVSMLEKLIKELTENKANTPEIQSPSKKK